MTLQIVISYLLYATGIIAGFFFLLFTLLFVKRERDEKRYIQKTIEDIGDVTALFQTMRGIVEQQKQLAAEFNEELDNKMQMVKQVLSQGLSRNEELYEHQRLLTRELETVALELKSIQRQVGELDETLHTEKTYERPRRFNAFQSRLERVPETPSNPEKARDAFRSILRSKAKEDDGPFPATGEDEEDKTLTNSEAFLQKQVESLHASGRDISEIAEELHIGKGEVRLILSLKEH